MAQPLSGTRHAQGVIALNIGLWFAGQAQGLRCVNIRRRELAVQKPVQEVEACWHVLLKRANTGSRNTLSWDGWVVNLDTATEFSTLMKIVNNQSDLVKVDQVASAPYIFDDFSFSTARHSLAMTPMVKRSNIMNPVNAQDQRKDR